MVALFLTFSAPARSAMSILVDADTGKVLSHHHATRPAHPASITKLMTAYTVFNEIRLGNIEMNSPVKITAQALAEPPSKMGFPVGTILNMDNAIKIIMVKSANDVATALAQSAKGSLSAFVEAMNQNAARLGMTGSHFANAHGLHAPEQVTTAKDMAILALAIQNEFPQHAGYFNIPAIKFGKSTLRNHNALLFGYTGTNGMKTGYTCPSGLNVVARAKRQGKQLIAVVLNAYSSVQRNVATAQLLSAGFNDSFNALEHPTLQNLVTTQQQYAVPKNLTPMVCKPNWSERNMTKKERRAKRKTHLAKMDLLRKIYLNDKVARGPTIKVSLGGATGLNPFNYRLKNGSTPPPKTGIPTSRPDRSSQPDE